MDVTGKSRRPTDEWSLCAQKSTQAVAFERLGLNGPVQAIANDPG
jgi:hypothetical protein